MPVDADTALAATWRQRVRERAALEQIVVALAEREPMQQVEATALPQVLDIKAAADFLGISRGHL